MLNLKVSPEDHRKIAEIAKIGSSISIRVGREVRALQLLISLTACHANGCTLDLDALLNADEATKAHDIFGIHSNIDQTTGKLDNFFIPRTAVQNAA